MTLKIYIENLKNIENIERKVKKKYVGKTYEIFNILTEKGLYKIKNNRIFLYKIKDNITQKIKLKSFVILFTEKYYGRKKKKQKIYHLIIILLK